MLLPAVVCFDLCGLDILNVISAVSPFNYLVFIKGFFLRFIEHNMGTERIRERLYDSNGQAMFAKVEVINETSFVVRLTQALTGWVDVEFFF